MEKEQALNVLALLGDLHAAVAPARSMLEKFSQDNTRLGQENETLKARVEHLETALAAAAAASATSNGATAAHEEPEPAQ